MTGGGGLLGSHLVERFRRAGGHLVAAAHRDPAKLPIAEGCPIDPISPYGVGKLAMGCATRWRRPRIAFPAKSTRSLHESLIRRESMDP